MLQLDRSTHERLTADLPGPLRTAAGDAFLSFEAMAAPTPREENWRYVDVPSGLLELAIPDRPGTAA